MANVNEGDRLAFVTHLVSKLCYLVRLVSRVQRSVYLVRIKHASPTKKKYIFMNKLIANT